jgi:uncharacterized membrane protein YdbT with pleckstrin-like domain
MANEAVVYRAKLHWIVFAWPVIWLVIAIICFANGAGGAGFIFLILSIGTGLVSLISYLTSEFGVTDKRVLVKLGFIRRSSLEVLLRKVEGIQVKQSILGRILGYGAVVVSGTGGSQDPFRKISTPLSLRKAVQEQIVKIEDGDKPAVATA